MANEQQTRGGVTENADGGPEFSADDAKKRKQRNVAIALGLGVFIVLVFTVTILRLGASVADRPF